MSAAPSEAGEWLEPTFWEWLEDLEARHQRVQCEHERARRVLERLTQGEIEQLHEAWRRYCEVIAELDQTSTEFASLRAC